MTKGQVSVAEMRKDLGEVLNRAHYRNEIVSIEKRSRPFANVVSNTAGDNLEKLRRLAHSLGIEPDELLDKVSVALKKDETKRAILGVVPREKGGSERRR